MARAIQFVSAADYLPSDRSLASLRNAAARCRGCELYKNATQVVFGEGPGRAEMILVGTMPGDSEDKAGRPFVGPAGRLLDKAIEQAGIQREKVYITNAVKHFKFVEQRNYRLHRNPGGREMKACRPWLEAEIDAVRPSLLVGLGTLAGESLLGRKVVLRDERGKRLRSIFGIETVVTIHPSALLRLRGHGGDFEGEYARFVSDLRAAREILHKETRRAA